MTDIPITWGETTPEEKGALLLAHHEGKEIQFINGLDVKEWKKAEPRWAIFCAYRVKPEPRRETVRLYAREERLRALTDNVAFRREWVFSKARSQSDTYCITFEISDGEPDCTSIQMEKIF